MATDSQFSAALGVYAAGDALVVRISDHVFPMRCVKTGAPTTERRTQEFVKLIWTVKTIAIAALLAILLGVSARSHSIPALQKRMDQRRFHLTYGLSPDWTAGVKRRDRRAWWTIGCGGVVILVGMFLAVGSSWGLAVVLAGALICVLGPVLTAFMIYEHPLRLKKLDGDFAWIGGCAPEFLGTIPRHLPIVARE